MGTVFGAATALTKDVGEGQAVPLPIQVVESFNNLSSLRAIVQCDTTAAFSAPKNVVEVELPVASLVAGRTFPITAIPLGVNTRFMRINYVVICAASTLGKVTAGVIAGSQTTGVNL